MAKYKLNGKLVDGTPFTVETSDQPEDISVFMNKAIKADWNTFIGTDGSVTAINMHLVSSITVKRI